MSGLVRTLKSRRVTRACSGASGRVGFEINASSVGPLVRTQQRADGCNQFAELLRFYNTGFGKDILGFFGFARKLFIFGDRDGSLRSFLF